MEKLNPQLVVQRFVSGLADAKSSHNSLIICASDFEILKLDSAHSKVNGYAWHQWMSEEQKYDYIVTNFSFGSLKEKVEISDTTVNIRKHWYELLQALRLLEDDGLCLTLIESSAFGMAEWSKYEEYLREEGYCLSAILNTPNGSIRNSEVSIPLTLVVITRSQVDKVFLAELESEEQSEQLVSSFLSKNSGNSLNQGLLIQSGTFKGFDRWKGEFQLSKLEAQYYDKYKITPLGDIALEINTVRNDEVYESKPNSIYIPRISDPKVGTSRSAVVCSLEDINPHIRHKNLFQVVLSDRVSNEYLSLFFQSQIGLIFLHSLSSTLHGTSRINRLDLPSIKVPLPDIDEQKTIILTYRKLLRLASAIENFQTELALNLTSATLIKPRLDNLLESIGMLSDADKVMSLARSGESKTVEFKQTFNLDVKKGTKEKYITESVLKTLVAFLNTDGGVLLVGISDSGEISGIDEEIEKFHRSSDAFMLDFKNHLKKRIGEQFYPFIDQRIVLVESRRVLVVECKKSHQPCFLDGEVFYVRTNPATDKLEGPKLLDYVKNRFG